jgi:predicted nucleic-acid-binding Zn-ribbon protein
MKEFVIECPKCGAENKEEDDGIAMEIIGDTLSCIGGVDSCWKCGAVFIYDNVNKKAMLREAYDNGNKKG